MGWKITTFDNKYQIKYGSNLSSSYANPQDGVSYLTITNDKRIGINNAIPSSNYLLDINGITHINSNLYVDGNIYVSSNVITSNIIGYLWQNSSNILQLNNTANYNNNIVKIYGKTSLHGKVYISSDANTNSKETPHLLDIEGSLSANSLYGNGANITNLNINNISTGIALPINKGGTGTTSIRPNEILFGGSDGLSFTQNQLFKIENNILYGPISASGIESGIIKVVNGGTGINVIPSGQIIFGGGLNSVNLSSDLEFVNSTSTLLVKNVTVADDLKISKIPLIKDNNNIYRNLHYSNIGVENASLDKFGLIKPSSSDFKFNIDNGELELTSTDANIWTYSELTNIINYPRDSVRSSGTRGKFGINMKPQYTPQYTLDVDGDINTSNGKFKIDGVDVFDGLRGTLGQSLAGLGAQFEQNSYEFSSNFLKTINIRTGSLFPGLGDIPPVLKNDQAIFIRGSFVDSWEIGSIAGSTVNNSFKVGTLDANILRVSENTQLNKININVIDSGTTELLTISKKSTNSEGQIITPKMLIFDRNGSLRIGDDLQSSGVQTEKINVIGDIKASGYIKCNSLLIDNVNSIIPVPTEKLQVVGNIIASGYIRSYYSDNRLKTFTSNITNALDIIDSLNGFYYVPNEKALEFGFEYDNEIGLSAQEVKKVIPEIVKIAPFDTTKINEKITSKSGEEYLTICYERLGAVFVEAIKELRKENKDLKREINILKNELNNIKKIIYIQ
jgi:hypothetical protein